MHRAKHRAAGRASAEVLAATLIERFADDARSSSTRHVTAALPQRGGVAVLDEEPAEISDLRDPGLFGVDLFGAAALTGSFLAVADDADHTAARAAAPLFRDDTHDDQSPFGAARHAACRRPAPSVPEVKQPVKHNKLRAQPVGAALTVTVCGSAIACPVADRAAGNGHQQVTTTSGCSLSVTTRRAVPASRPTAITRQGGSGRSARAASGRPTWAG